MMASLDDLIANSWFPFEGDIKVKPFEPAVIPEPERLGVEQADCRACNGPDNGYLWTDARWRLTGLRPAQIPGIVLLETRDHHDSFADLTPDLLTELGPTIARVERACLAVGDVGRVHLNRWGEGSAHFHIWFIPRPLGAMQLRGSILPMWLDLMPDLDEDVVERALARIAAAMAT